MSSSEREQAKREAQSDLHSAKQNARESAHEAKEAAEDVGRAAGKKAHEAKEKAVEVKDSFIQRLREDGVVNPNGFAMLAFGPIFLAAIPAVTFAAQPGGLLQKAVNGVAHGAAYFATAGSSSAIAQTAKISALSLVYLTATFAFGGAFSATAIDTGSQGGRNNGAPRKQVSSLQGLPYRLNAAAQHTLENFSSYALVAALAQAISPADQSIINLLGLHVITKLAVYGPSYLFDVPTVRSISHVIATSTVLAVGVKLVKAPFL